MSLKLSFRLLGGWEVSAPRTVKVLVPVDKNGWVGALARSAQFGPLVLTWGQRRVTSDEWMRTPF